MVAWKTYFRRRAPLKHVTSNIEKYELNPTERLRKYDSADNAVVISRAPVEEMDGLRFEPGEMIKDFMRKFTEDGYHAPGLMLLSEYRILLERHYVN